MPVKIDRTGETRINNQGLKMTIVAYRRADDIDVAFEDGSVREHMSYKKFQDGGIQNKHFPNVGHITRMSTMHNQRLGETNINTQGRKMKIVEYRSAKDIDVQFEDGVIRQHLPYFQFSSGTLLHPSDTLDSRIGKSNKNNQGLLMTVVDYKSAADMSVRFEDGAIRTHVAYKEFMLGKVPHPKDTLGSHQTDRKGESILATCGISMQILEYTASDNITVQFETGYICHKKKYRIFRLGHIGHPFPYQIGNITMNGLAYIYNNEGNFYCFCNKCKKSDIMTIDEMKSHICNI